MTWLEDDSKFCQTCGSRVLDGRGVEHPCPVCSDPKGHR